MDTSKKIIRGVVNSRGFTITSPITQWDYGWQFIPEIEDLPPTYRLDFSNEEKHGTALPVYCSTDGAEVPTELIDTGKDIWVWYVAIGDGYGITEYKWRIPNKCKPKTEQDEPTPSQQSSIDQLIVRSNEAVEQAEQSASDASTSAQNASADAERAEEARTDAQNYADMAEQARDDAQTYANNASASATASAQSASASAQIKSDIEGMVDDAQGYAQASAQSATASANSATTAQGYANTASASAQSASTSASDALTYANTASSKASEASTSAQTASQKATEASQSATNASQSAQDAEQAKTDAQTAQGLAESARDSAITAKNDAESARDDAVQAKTDVQNIADGIDTRLVDVESALIDKAPVITDTASGSIASFTDGADNLPLKSLIVDIDPIQDLHGQDAPYPAGGGKNLFDPSVYSAYLQSDGKYRAMASQINPIQIPIPSSLLNTPCTFSFYADMTNAGTLTTVLTQAVVGGVSKNGNIVQNGSIGRSTVTFTPTSESDYIHITFGSNGANEFTFYNIQLEASSAVTDYAPYSNLCPISGWTGATVVRDGKNLLALPVVRFNEAEATKSNCFFVKAGTYILQYSCDAEHRYGIRLLDMAGNVISDGAHKPNASAPYNSSAQAYYAGLNVPSGFKTVVCNIVEDCYVRIVSNQTGGGFTNAQFEKGSTATSYEPYNGQTINIDWATEAGTVYGGKLDVLTGILTVYPYYDSYNGETLTGEWISDCDKYVAGTTPTIGAQVVNIGAQDVTVQLEPHEVGSLYGVNNIWADSGDTEVEYRADTKAWIQRKIAEAIASLT